MPMKRVRFVHSDALERHDYPEGVPFSARRAGDCVRILNSMKLLPEEQILAPRAATRAELERFHSPAYLDVLIRAEQGHFDPVWLEMGLGSDECPAFPGMYEHAALVAGGSLLGAEELIADRADLVFCPSGGMHHAGAGHAAGFCYLNDVVLACMSLAAAGKKVLFLDVDAHHGDGVQDAFEHRAEIFTLSLHESGKTLFPGTGFVEEIGRGAGLGHCANIPLPAGCHDEAFRAAFEELALPLMEAFAPDVVVLELGMDALAGDPLAHLELTNNVFADLLETLMERNWPMLVTGGGGYHLRNTARGWALAWGILTEADLHEDLSLGMGGMMMESTDWLGGLRDRRRIPAEEQRRAVAAELTETTRRFKEKLFPRWKID